jgi:hypothetical protein
MTNAIMLDASWKWLPKTAIFVNVTQGFVTYLEEPTPQTPSSIRCARPRVFAVC